MPYEEHEHDHQHIINNYGNYYNNDYYSYYNDNRYMTYPQGLVDNVDKYTSFKKNDEPDQFKDYRSPMHEVKVHLPD